MIFNKCTIALLFLNFFLGSPRWHLELVAPCSICLRHRKNVLSPRIPHFPFIPRVNCCWKYDYNGWQTKRRARWEGCQNEYMSDRCVRLPRLANGERWKGRVTSGERRKKRVKKMGVDGFGGKWSINRRARTNRMVCLWHWKCLKCADFRTRKNSTFASPQNSISQSKNIPLLVIFILELIENNKVNIIK